MGCGNTNLNHEIREIREKGIELNRHIREVGSSRCDDRTARRAVPTRPHSVSDTVHIKELG
jgi:hypothetical protein